MKNAGMRMLKPNCYKYYHLISLITSADASRKARAGQNGREKKRDELWNPTGWKTWQRFEFSGYEIAATLKILIKSFIHSIAKAKLMADKSFSISEQKLRDLHLLLNKLYRFMILNEPCCNWPPERERKRRQGLIERALADVTNIIFNIDHKYTLELMKSLI
ncbi:MAG TPA: hypothetical protein VIE65_09240 [Methylobacter sp.]